MRFRSGSLFITVGRPGQAAGGIEKLVPSLPIEPRRGCRLDELLMASLQGAVAFPETGDGTTIIRDDLNFEMVSRVDPSFREEGIRTEGSKGLDL